MTELDLISRLRRRPLVRGVGDDCYVFRPRPSEELVFTTDMLIEDVHFRRSTHKAADIGWKTLARGLSDIAAMGATPRFCLLSLALPAWASPAWIERFYDGLFLHGLPLCGGDLARAERLTCDIVVCGSVPRGKALLRSGARPGDAIYVSGVLGGSALGLATGKGAAWKRHLRPQPRVGLGAFLRKRLRASAAMDLSDGLSLDLRRLCLESGVSAALDRPLPAFPGASLDQVLHGGEDYELLFTVRDRRAPAKYEGIPLTRIGTIEKGTAGAVTLFGAPVPPSGYDHLTSASRNRSESGTWTPFFPQSCRSPRRPSAP